MSYDQKCLDLAEAFLADHPSLDPKEHGPKIAQAIQDRIEQDIDEALLELDAYKNRPQEDR